jgi:hypothetical protein
LVLLLELEAAVWAAEALLWLSLELAAVVAAAEELAAAVVEAAAVVVAAAPEAVAQATLVGRSLTPKPAQSCRGGGSWRQPSCRRALYAQ